MNRSVLLLLLAIMVSCLFVGAVSCGGGGGGGGDAAQCSDAVDNDADGWVDAADPDCDAGDTEDGFGITECNDGVDNDGDGDTDADDFDCENADDDQEAVVAVAPGSYTYSLLPLASFSDAVDVAYHPDGSYLLIVERTGTIHAYSTTSGAAVQFDVAPPGEALLWEDVDFDPSGGRAILTGMASYGSTTEGVIYSFDDAAWRSYAGSPSITVVTEYTGLPAADSFAAIAWPWDGGQPAVLGRSFFNPNNVASLYAFDVSSGATSSLGSAVTSAGCQDIAFMKGPSDNETILISCGINGTQVFYRFDNAGADAFTNIDTTGMGNMSHIAPQAGGGYALIVDWSSRRVRRVEGGQFDPSTIWFAALDVYRATFDPAGRRALIYGGAGGTPLSAPVIEYRHGSYSCATPFSDCAFTDVSIPDFDLAPWNATANYWLRGAAWSPACDGGLLVGGYQATGIAVKFDLVGGVNCW